MSGYAIEPPVAEPPVAESIPAGDDNPGDLLARQRRLLTEPLCSSWDGPGGGRPFVAAANVGLFPSIHRPSIVPDVFVSVDVERNDELPAYFLWEAGKPPDVAIEIFLGHDSRASEQRKQAYARMGITYFARFDPLRLLQPELLRVAALSEGQYELRLDGRLSRLGLGLVIWHGDYEDLRLTWVRWCDRHGQLIPTARERCERSAAGSGARSELGRWQRASDPG